jgi:hypothetical protein
MYVQVYHGQPGHVHGTADAVQQDVRRRHRPHSQVGVGSTVQIWEVSKHRTVTVILPIRQ